MDGVDFAGLIGAVLLVGCGPTPAAPVQSISKPSSYSLLGAPEAVEAPTAATWGAAFDAVLCAREHRECRMTPPMASDETACREKRAARGGRSALALDARLRTGELQIDQELALRCLRETAGVCGAERTGVPLSAQNVCRIVVFTPGARTGTDCAIDADCPRGDLCFHGRDECRSVGWCRPPMRVGEACRLSSDCSYDKPTVCLDGRCTSVVVSETVGVGARCGLSEGVLTPCARSLVCVGGRCIVPVADGGACRSIHECANGGLCLGGVCEVEQESPDTCGPACLLAVDRACVDGRCVDTDGELGSPCEGDPECVAELRCVESRCRAVVPSPVGSECLADTQCASRCCAAHRCVVPPPR